MRCKATKRDGTPCTLPARGNSGLCWAHAPENAEKRREIASKAGRARTGNEIAEIKARIKELSEAVVEGRVERGKASVAFQGYGILARVIEIERKQRSDQEL